MTAFIPQQQTKHDRLNERGILHIQRQHESFTLYSNFLSTLPACLPVVTGMNTKQRICSVKHNHFRGKTTGWGSKV